MKNIAGMNVLVTGAFKKEINGVRVTRNMIFRIIKSNNGIPAKNFSEDVDILVNCQDGKVSNKIRMCEENDIKVISEKQFWKMVA